MKISLTFRLPFLLMLIVISFSVYGQTADLPVPPNTKFSLELLSPISTATGKKGDKFSCKVLTPAEYAGAIVEGHIRTLKRSGKADKESKIDLAFDRIALANGRSEDFGATVVEVFDVTNVAEQGRADNEGTVRSKSNTVKISIKRAAAGALIGALIGGVVAGGKGAVLGAALGAGVGATTTLATRGADLEFRTGTQFTVDSTGSTRRKNQESASATVAPSPQAPSRTYRLFMGKGFGMSVPDNWHESSSANSVSFAPPGGNVNYQGRANLTHGAMAGIFAAGVQDLQTGANQLVGVVLRTNSYLQQRGEYVNSDVGPRGGLEVTLYGIPAATGRAEIVTVHTTLLQDGSVFYVITVVPEHESGSYREAFSNVLRSVQFQ